MNTTEILEVSRETIFVLLQVGAPVMLVTLIVGLAISLIQALTQIQEQTLVFVPKIIVAMLSLILLLPFMLSVLTGFTERLADRIINIG
ncbi:MAG: flagellar biosynthesis protein FliQ [Rhodospirillales bacterium]